MKSFVEFLVRKRTYLRTIGAGLLTFAAVYAIDHFLARLHMAAEATILDDLLLGILVALLVLFLELGNQRELSAQKDKLSVALAMNHHIRNALQTIIYVNYNNPDPEARKKVSDAAKRIEWALREVLSGNKQAEPTTAVRRHPGDTRGSRDNSASV